jgi:hypothetical protein
MVNDSAVVVFDDERAVANAGVILRAVLAGRLGIECRELLRHAQEGARPAPLLAHQARADRPGLRLHRGLLQPDAPTLDAGLPLARAVRASRFAVRARQNDHQGEHDLTNRVRRTGGTPGHSIPLLGGA